jgi:hypothetical protein
MPLLLTFAFIVLLIQATLLRLVLLVVSHYAPAAYQNGALRRTLLRAAGYWLLAKDCCCCHALITFLHDGGNLPLFFCDVLLEDDIVRKNAVSWRFHLAVGRWDGYPEQKSSSNS